MSWFSWLFEGSNVHLSKGGVNKQPSQVTERPAPPAASPSPKDAPQASDDSYLLPLAFIIAAAD